MMETGFLKFGGDVKKEQYNFAGLGAVRKELRLGKSELLQGKTDDSRTYGGDGT